MIRSPRTHLRRLSPLLLYAATLAPLLAQAPAAPPQNRVGDIEQRLTTLTATLAQTQAALQQSQAELESLRAELAALRHQPAEPAPATTSIQAQLDTLKEQQDILQAEVKQHEQTKLESASKYPVTVTGLVLFNAFSNAGVVDNAELPALALPRNSGSSHGSVGATLRQTVLGVVATGPAIAGAQTTAIVNMDFFGGTTTNSFGYTALDGYLRMRDTQLSLAWSRTRVELGYTGPLISPLSPTSFATVAQPALSASGNLWSWSPQLALQQNLPLGQQHGISLEAGLIYPQSPAYNSVQLDSPVEAARRPGVEGRIAFHADNSATPSSRALAFGVGAYTASQFYSSATQIHSWAVTGDWQIPLSHRFDLSGEIYRGNALGGLGAGLYKDILTGADPVTGLSRTVGVDTVGGWSQLKFNLRRYAEANAMFGLDNAFSSTFHSIILPAGSNSLTLTARNSTVTGNLIFRPRASLIFSPEYRRLLTWRYASGPYVVNIFTLSAGYKF